MKPKAKTLQQRFGFKDNDLKTPTHDKIILSLLSTNKKLLVLLNTIYTKNNIEIECRCKDLYAGKRGHDEILYCVMLLGPLYKECKEGSSDPYYSERDFFNEHDIEDLIKYRCPFYKRENPNDFTLCPNHEVVSFAFKTAMNLTNENILMENKDNISINTEVPITTKNKYIIGFIDVIISYFQLSLSNDYFKIFLYEDDECVRGRSVSVFIEVKTQVESFGETMRQINMYREHMGHSSPFILITKSLGYKEAFESQGIYVYEWGTQKTLNEEK